MHGIRNLIVIITMPLFAVSASHAEALARTSQRLRTTDDAAPALFEFVSRKSTFLYQMDQNLKDEAILKILHDAYSEDASSNLALLISGLRRPARSYLSLQRSPGSGVIRIAVEDFPELAERWSVSSLPTFLVIDQRGVIVARHDGLMSREAFMDFLAPPPPREPDHPAVPSASMAVFPKQSAPDLGAPATWIRSSGGATPEIIFPSAGTSSSWTGSSGEGMPGLSGFAIIPWTTNTVDAPRAPSERIMSERPEQSPSPRAVSLWTGSSGADTSFRGRFLVSGRKEFLYTRRFSAPSLWHIRLMTDLDDVDADVEVFDEQGNRVASGESPLGKEELLLAVGEGAYTMRIFTNQRISDPASFKVNEEYSPLPADRVIPATNGKILTLDVPEIVAMLPGKEQWFLFTAEQPGRYALSVNPRHDGPSIEASVINSAGEIIGPNRIIRGTVAPGGEPEFLLDVSPQQRVALRIRLSDLTGSSTVVGVTVARYTKVNVDAVKSMIEPGQTISGTIGGSAGIEHVYRVKVSTEGTWSLSLQSPRQDADIDMEILKPDAVLVERSEGPTSSENLVAEIGPEDERYIRVYAYRAAEPIEFTLKMNAATETRRAPEPMREPTRENQTVIKPPSDATPLAVNVRQHDALDVGETHWYRIQADQTGRYGLFLDGDPAESDIDMAVHAGSGEQTAISQSDLPREALLLDLVAGEPVFVRVFSYRDSPASTYMIWFERVGR